MFIQCKKAPETQQQHGHMTMYRYDVEFDKDSTAKQTPLSKRAVDIYKFQSIPKCKEQFCDIKQDLYTFKGLKRPREGLKK